METEFQNFQKTYKDLYIAFTGNKNFEPQSAIEVLSEVSNFILNSKIKLTNPVYGGKVAVGGEHGNNFLSVSDLSIVELEELDKF